MPRQAGPELVLYSERLPPVGAIGGEGAVKAVGKPALSFWEVFLRETLQNSWDARLGEQIGFRVRGMHLQPDQVVAMRNGVFVQLPPPVDAGSVDESREGDGQSCSPLYDARTQFRDFLESREPRALLVQDVRTRGLGGPARADIVVPQGTVTDFRNFVFEIGKNAKEVGSGGTFGFGKGVLYAASRIRTCLIYTSTMEDGRPSYRFIASRVGPEFVSGSRRFTGRHWWGTVEDDGVLPLEGLEALTLAGSLGMGLPDGATGTSILVLDPGSPDQLIERPDGRKERDRDGILRAILEEIRSAALKWAWPHLVGEDGVPTIDFDLSVDDESLPVILDDDPVLRQYADAYRQALLFARGEPVNHTVQATRLLIGSGRPATGVLVVRKSIHDGLPEDLDRHVALMRAPRFVVKYRRIEKDPLGQFTAGVFIVDPEIDRSFAEAEPVTHDEWRREQGGVRVRPVAWTLDDIDRATRSTPASIIPETDQRPSTGLARVAESLGREILGVTGRGAGILPRRRSGSGAPRRPISVTVVGDPRPIRAVGERVEAEFPVSVVARPSADLSAYRVSVAPKAVAESGTTERGRDVERHATVVGWRIGDEEHAGASIPADLLAAADGDVRVLVSHDRLVAVTIAMKTEEV